ncbi:MAG TPA: hypothetical protein VHC22_32675 [Pirellulales bacterium]|nr:hypothetical protein [Pirellulales bacterium]
MTRWFRFSLLWGLFGAGFGAALGVAICWAVGVDPAHWIRMSVVLAFVFGLLGAFLGDETLALIREVLGCLIS